MKIYTTNRYAQSTSANYAKIGCDETIAKKGTTQEALSEIERDVRKVAALGDKFDEATIVFPRNTHRAFADAMKSILIDSGNVKTVKYDQSYHDFEYLPTLQIEATEENKLEKHERIAECALYEIITKLMATRGHYNVFIIRAPSWFSHDINVALEDTLLKSDQDFSWIEGGVTNSNTKYGCQTIKSFKQTHGRSVTRFGKSEEEILAVTRCIRKLSKGRWYERRIKECQDEITKWSAKLYSTDMLGRASIEKCIEADKKTIKEYSVKAEKNIAVWNSRTF